MHGTPLPYNIYIYIYIYYLSYTWPKIIKHVSYQRYVVVT